MDKIKKQCKAKIISNTCTADKANNYKGFENCFLEIEPEPPCTMGIGGVLSENGHRCRVFDARI